MLSNLKISTRLAIMLVFFLVGLVIVGGAGLYSSGKLNKAMRSIYDDRMLPTLNLYAIHTANLNNVVAISKAIAEPENMEQYIREIENNKSLIDNEWKKYMTILQRDVKDSEEDQMLTGMFVEARKHFFEEGIKPAVAAMRAKNLDEVKRIQQEHIFPLTFPLNEALNILINMETNEAILAHREGGFLFGGIRMVSILTILFIVILGGTLGFSIIHSVHRSVNELHNVMAQMTTDGDTSARAKIFGKDEIGQVTGEFNALLDNINSLSELKPVFDNLEEGVVFIDHQRRVIAINKAACHLLGQDSSAVLNKLCPDVFHGIDCAEDCKKGDHCTHMAGARQEEKFQDIAVRRPDDVLVSLRMLTIDLPSKRSLIFRGANW